MRFIVHLVAWSWPEKKEKHCKKVKQDHDNHTTEIQPPNYLKNNKLNHVNTFTKNKTTNNKGQNFKISFSLQILSFSSCYYFFCCFFLFMIFLCKFDQERTMDTISTQNDSMEKSVILDLKENEKLQPLEQPEREPAPGRMSLNNLKFSQQETVKWFVFALFCFIFFFLFKAVP